MSESKTDFIEKFKERTKKYSLHAIRIYKRLPKTEESSIIGRQFLRSALSVGANYRAVCRARSKAEFFSKLSITVEEADEVIFGYKFYENRLSLMMRIFQILKRKVERFWLY